jgi:hypothetical protein
MNQPLSLPRRWMGDLVQLAQATPSATLRRTMQLVPLAAVRQIASPRPGWCAMMVKAYAMLAARRPVLRQIYVPLPWPHLYEHSCNVATVAVARTDEDAVYFARLQNPETLSLWDLEKWLRATRETQLNRVAEFRQLARWSRLPRPIRRAGWWLVQNTSGQRHATTLGTFGVSSLAGWGALDAKPLSVWTMALSYGPVARDGSVDVCLTYDPRVRDAATVATALADLEDVLLGEIVNELGYLRELEAA